MTKDTTKANPPTRLLSAEHTIMTWHHVAEFGETFEMFLKPQAWSHVARQLMPGHEIIVIAADGTWRGHLYVRATGRVEAIVGAVNYQEFGAKTEVEDDVPYEAKWRGPTAKWSVANKETQEVVKQHMQTKEAAVAWITSHMQALAA